MHLAQCARYNCGPYGSNPSWWIVTNGYDLAGDLTSYTDAFGNSFTQNFTKNSNSASRPYQLTSSWVDSTHPANLVSSATYSSNGALKSASLGNGLAAAYAYNNRFQPCRMNWNSANTALSQCSDPIPSTGNVLDFNYNFVDSNGHNNGNLASWNAVGQQSFTRSFQYDSLNRIAQMQETGGNVESCKPASSPSTPYAISWTIDPWGNRTNQSPSAGTCSFSQPVNTKNQFSTAPYQYDAAGNMTFDGTNYYFYDAENRLAEVYPSSYGNQGTQPPACTSTGVSCYFYNAEGQRISKYANAGLSAVFYLYDTNGEVLADTDGNQNWNETYVHFGGQLIAQYRGSWTGFLQEDHLGSTRLDTVYVPSGVTPPSGCTVPSGATYCVYDNMDYLPFGEQIAGGSGTTHKFTGKERDAESGLDNFGARYNSSSLGRFLSPDWSSSPSTVPYASLPYPQSLNLYAYVQNNPLKSTDPTGHCTVDGETHNWLWCAGHSLGFTETKTETATRERHDAEVREFLRKHPEYLQNAILMAASLGTALAIEAGGMGSGEDGNSTVTPEENAAIEAGAATGAEAGVARTMVKGVPQPAAEGEIVVGPNGTAVKIPAGYVAEPAANGNGIVYRPAGSTGNANIIRISGPDKMNPTGSVRIYNSEGQPIIPSTGKPGTNAQTHSPL